MNFPHILIMDLNPNTYPTDPCRRLAEQMYNSLSVMKPQIHTVTLFPPKKVPFFPDIILFRPFLAQNSSEIIRFLRRNWNLVPILGLFCHGKTTSPSTFQFLLEQLDDFLSCPFNETDLYLRIQRIFQSKKKILPPFQTPQTEKIKVIPYRETLIGESKSFLQVIEKISGIACSDAVVLITGETGTGKELVARAIHYQSPRQGKPFIPLNCGALPEHLIENELFGHVKGAFTDASSTEKGLLAEAEGGTLFLDEVDSLSVSAQVKLLRFLQDREYRPLGSSKSLTADVRIIAATNANLRQQIQARQFREDLYYRLNILSLHLPPLRGRMEDIPLLANHFLTQYGKQYHRGSFYLSPGALQKLLAYPWPGNVRELESVIHRTVILSSTPVLQPRDIELPFSYYNEIPTGESFQEAKARVIQQFEQTYLTCLLTIHKGNITQAAKQARKERRSFQRLLRKYNLHRSTFQS
jgi:DNA-binding NtrC family response regulator